MVGRSPQRGGAWPERNFSGPVENTGFAYSGRFLGAHCTGIEAVYRIRTIAGLNRQTCVVGVVARPYSLAKSINPVSVAK